MTKHAWQDFAVTGGIIARDESDLIEGRLELSGGLEFTFILRTEGAGWSWSPGKPLFRATRVSIASDADPDIEMSQEEALLLAEHGIGEDDFRKIQMLEAAGHDLADRQSP